MNGPAVINDVKFAVLILAEADDFKPRVHQLAAPGHATAIVAQLPNLAGLVVAIDVAAGQVRQALAAINTTARDGSSFRMRMLPGRRQKGRGAAFAVRLHRLMTSFEDAPAIIAAALHAINHLPQFPAHVAHPQIPGLPVDAHPPRVAQSVSPDLRARAGHVHERIVWRHAIRPALFGVIDIDPQDGGKQVANVLTGVQRVRRIGTGPVPGRNVEIAVQTETDATAIVPARFPGDHRLLAFQIDLRRVRVRHFETRDVRAVRQFRLQDVPDIDLAVPRKLRMESQAVTLRYLRIQLLEVGKQIGTFASLVIRKRKNLSRMLDDQPAI